MKSEGSESWKDSKRDRLRQDSGGVPKKERITWKKKRENGQLRGGGNAESKRNSKRRIPKAWKSANLNFFTGGRGGKTSSA